MISSTNSNIYEVNAIGTLDVYGDFINGLPRCTVLAISCAPLSTAAAEALEKSAVALGYGAGACAFVVLADVEGAGDAGGAAAGGAGGSADSGAGACAAGGAPNSGGASAPALGASDLFSIVEGLDPLAVVVADEASAELFGHAFRASVPLDGFARVFGRPAVAFRNLNDLMGSSQGKQKAWALLKKLPRLN